MRVIVLPGMLVTKLQSHEQNLHQTTMRKKNSKSRCTTRCQSSAERKAQSEMMLSTSFNVVLLENGVLKLVSVVHTMMFQQKRFSIKLSKYSAAHANWSGSRCSGSRRCSSNSRRPSSSGCRCPLPPFCCCLPSLLLPWLLRLLLPVTHLRTTGD